MKTLNRQRCQSSKSNRSAKNLTKSNNSRSVYKPLPHSSISTPNNGASTSDCIRTVDNVTENILFPDDDLFTNLISEENSLPSVSATMNNPVKDNDTLLNTNRKLSSFCNSVLQPPPEPSASTSNLRSNLIEDLIFLPATNDVDSTLFSNHVGNIDKYIQEIEVRQTSSQQESHLLNKHFVFKNCKNVNINFNNGK